MARIKVTNTNIQQRLVAWNNNTGTSRQDELVFYANEINEQDVKQLAWDVGNMIINFQPDVVSGFTKITFVEKL
jgi:hypothetical protein